MNTDEKLCPFCGETIKEIAIKCKHCQSSLLPANPLPTVKILVPCQYCGEDIDKDATKCEFCDSILNGPNDRVQSNSSQTITLSEGGDGSNSVRFQLTILGFIETIYLIIEYATIKNEYYGLFVFLYFGFFGFIIYAAILYTKDRSSLPFKDRLEIPWYANLFCVIFFPFIAIPLYLNWYQTRIGKESNDVTVSVAGWVVYGIAIISVMNSISNMLLSIFELN